MHGIYRVLIYHMRFVCKRLDERRLSQGTSHVDLYARERSVREVDVSRNWTCRCAPNGVTSVLVSVTLQNGCHNERFGSAHR